ncbi:sulfate ABC transporter permease subunit CysW [Prosthecomicrobium pneumaticum]|uniref:Sulfate transport system permease protein n=1 Tax=Prosthecomicrobium pneumaticum TaxID=81895 RepID=A0A7W9FJ86_9HYPH|nr:sulfate ABC transporter permease subunit CysW [Prosthecomicrobium pneumaticum]MBB5751255.1 sulfate transport system permease protein [Prosthecomicrobium pneumaticum]
MSRAGAAVREGRAARGALLGAVLLASLLVLVAPVAIVFIEAFGAGLSGFAATLAHPDTRAAIGLSIVTALLVVPVNTLFGIAAAWAIARFRFPGRRLLLATIEVPFSVSPIVAGIAYLFVYGGQGLLGPFLEAHELRIMFALPGIVLASMFVTAPYVVHQLIPLMEAQGSDEEEVAATLGAGGFAIFRRVTLPNIRWALLYGVVLCNARVLGEFGAVSIVSGNIRGQTNTLPLHIELLYHDYNTMGAFAAASVLALAGLLTLVAKWLLERSGARQG